jgi:outer membrane protein OmpA-like peptidoglycan-associated protein
MRRQAAALLALALVAAACAPQDRVLLLPGESGADIGALAVLGQSGKTVSVISQPYTEATVSGETITTNLTDAEAVERRDGELLKGLPPPPTAYILYFEEGTARLVAESEPALKALLKDAGERPGADIQVTGHTDTVGSQSDNDALSLRRAQSIRDLLIRQGLDPETVRAVGRGERELLIKTADGVGDARNRRVEVTVR